MKNIFYKTELSAGMKKNILKAIELIRPDQDEIGIPGTKTERLVRKNTPAHEERINVRKERLMAEIEDEFIVTSSANYRITFTDEFAKDIARAKEMIRPDQYEIKIPDGHGQALVRKNTPAYERLTKELSPLKYFSIDDEYIYAVCMSFEIILKMFGTEDARKNFLNLCREYYGERVRHEAAEQAQAQVLDSRRAELHNEIMVIIQKLYIPTSSIPPTRKEVGEMIMAYFREEVTNRR